MKAIYFEEHGNLEVLKYGSVEEPKSSGQHAIIKVLSVALNHLDIWVRRGWKGLNLAMPHITGCDIVGEIISLPRGVTGINVGQKVIVYPGVSTIQDEWTRAGEPSLSPGYKIIGENFRGGLADYVAVPTDCLLTVPSEYLNEELACLPLVSLTCWRMLFKQAKLMPGESVLIVGSGGGVNLLSMQMAQASGCEVIVLAGTHKKAERIAKLGISKVIRYDQNKDWHKEVLKITKGRGVDLVVDNVGQATIKHSIKALRRGGRLVTVGNTSGADVTFDNRLIFTKQVSLIGSTMGSIQDLLSAINFMQHNKIKPIIDSVTPLSEGISQIKRLEAGEQFGRIVLVP